MKVLLAIPTLNSLHYSLVPWVVKMCMDKRHEVTLFINSMVGNEANRNAITRRFLDGDDDYLLMIDSDQEPTANPLDMVQHDKDVMSMPTVIQLGKIAWNVFDRCDDPQFTVEARTERSSGIERVYAIGTGCVLIKRHVLEVLKNPFSPRRDADDSRIVTQDILFSMKCDEAGLEIWTDWEHPLKHFKEIDLLSL